jgi:hypothetical protein
MASLNTMVLQVSGLTDTNDLNAWENEFVLSVVEQTDEGKDTRTLTERQIDVLTRIHRKHFAL